MVTDPPYGVDYDPTWRHSAGRQPLAPTRQGEQRRAADWGAAWALFPGEIAYVWHGALHATTVAESLRTARAFRHPRPDHLGEGAAGHRPRRLSLAARALLVRRRARRAIGPATASRPRSGRSPAGDQDAETVHGTQKPVECMRRPMLNNSSPGQAVYDPFLGSGTTLIAAETTGRVCLGMEFEPLYVDVAVRRWQAFTGMTACLHGDGRSFDVVSAERLTSLQDTNLSPTPAQPVENPDQN